VQVIGAPLATGFLRMDGIAGLRGWQWVFIAEGAPTLLLGVCMPFLLPRDAKSARCLTISEAHALDQEVTACRGGNSPDEHTLAELLKMALTNSVMYIIGVVKFAKDFTSYGCMFWAPMLIKGLLHKHQRNGDSCSAWEGSDSDVPETGYKEVLLTGIPYSFAALTSILVAWNSQVCTKSMTCLFSYVSLAAESW
jgi:sugar phosphate permease